MVVSYIPMLYWVLREVYESNKPKKRMYKKTKTNDNWLWQAW